MRGSGAAVLLPLLVLLLQRQQQVAGVVAASDAPSGGGGGGGGGGGSTCDDSVLGLTEVAWHSEPSHIYLGSPSILRLSNRTILITADRFGDGFKGQPRNVSLYVSHDNGGSWAFHTWIMAEYWANLFAHRGQIFLLGTATDGPAPIKISSSADGLSWAPSDTAVLNNATYNTGPTPSLISGGRIYRAMELFVAPHIWGKDYEAMMIHASVDADLMDPGSWTVTVRKTLLFLHHPSTILKRIVSSRQARDKQRDS